MLERNNRLLTPGEPEQHYSLRLLVGIFSAFHCFLFKHQQLGLYVLSCSSKVQDGPLNWFEILLPETERCVQQKP